MNRATRTPGNYRHRGTNYEGPRRVVTERDRRARTAVPRSSGRRSTPGDARAFRRFVPRAKARKAPAVLPLKPVDRARPARVKSPVTVKPGKARGTRRERSVRDYHPRRRHYVGGTASSLYSGLSGGDGFIQGVSGRGLTTGVSGRGLTTGVSAHSGSGYGGGSGDFHHHYHGFHSHHHHHHHGHHHHRHRFGHYSHCRSWWFGYWCWPYSHYGYGAYLSFGSHRFRFGFGYHYHPGYYRHHYYPYYRRYAYYPYPYYSVVEYYPAYRSVYYSDYATVSYADTTDPYVEYVDEAPSDATLVPSLPEVFLKPFVADFPTGLSAAEAIAKGEQWLKEEDYPRAAEAFRVAWVAQPEDYYAPFQLTAALFGMGRYEVAGLSLTEGLDRNSSWTHRRFDVRDGFSSHAAFGSLVKDLQRHVLRFPDDHRSTFLLGYLSMYSGEEFEANRIFEGLKSAKWDNRHVDAFKKESAARLLETPSSRPEGK